MAAALEAELKDFARFLSSAESQRRVYTERDLLEWALEIEHNPQFRADCLRVINGQPRRRKVR